MNMLMTTKDFDWSNELEKTVLHSLVTTFGLDFLLLEDKKGGDVDTIHNVRQGIWATEEEKANYDNREDYNSQAYHSDPRYIQKGREDKKLQEQGVLQDQYREGVILENKKGTRQLDHTISAKEISDDPGRVLAGLNGVDLANDESNLNSTHWYINNVKGTHSVEDCTNEIFPEKVSKLETSIKRQEEKIKSMPTNTPEEESHKKQAIKKLESDKKNKKVLEDALKDPEKIREADAKARLIYNQKINMAYYSSSKFLGKTIKEMNKKGLAMGTRQALGLVLAEVWFELREQLPTIYKNQKDNFDFERLLCDVQNTIKNIWERVQSRFADLLNTFKESYFGGMLSSLTTTILNIFLTTEKLIGKMIRELWNSLVGVIKLILFNPNRLSLGNLLKEAFKLLAAGVFTLFGTMVYSYFEGFLFQFPLGNEIAAFISALATGILNLGFVYFLEHSALAKKVWGFLNKLCPNRNFEIAMENIKAINGELDRFLVELTKIEFNMSVEELRTFSEELSANSSELERSFILQKEIERRNIELPYEAGNLESFRDFLISKCNN